MSRERTRHSFSISSALFLSAVFALLSVVTLHVFAEVYKENEAFVAEQFPEGVPEVDFVWLTDELKPTVAEIMAHPYEQLRIKYWLKDNKSVWILEEIGKEKPITTGIVVENNAVTKVEILTFRESRGWEVRHDFFTNQFKGVQLKEDKQLTEYIDGITGATLSVRAVTKLARLALFFHQHVQHEA